MRMTCRNLCERLYSKIIVGNSKYQGGKKYCRRCDVYFLHDGLFSPCCDMRLRISPVNKRDTTTLRHLIHWQMVHLWLLLILLNDFQFLIHKFIHSSILDATVPFDINTDYHNKTGSQFRYMYVVITVGWLMMKLVTLPNQPIISLLLVMRARIKLPVGER